MKSLWCTLAWLLGVAGCAMAFAAAAAPAPATLAEVESQLRGQPEKAEAALNALLPRLRGAAQVEALMVRGQFQVQANNRAGTERTAQELDQLAAGADGQLAAAAAGLLRANAVAKGGPASRADRILDDAMAHLPADATDSMRLRFINAQATLKRSQSKLDVAVALFQQAVDLADRTGQDWRRADARGWLAFVLALAQQPKRGLEINREGLAIAMASGDLQAQSEAMTVEGIIAGMLGMPNEELRAGQAAIELARRAGATRREGLALANLADFYLKRGDYPAALRLSQQALPLTRQAKDQESEAVALVNAGLALIAIGRHDEGKALARQALILEESAGALSNVLAIQQELGAMLERVGQLREAWDALSEYRRQADEVFQRQHQQAVLELQEGFDAERRRRELDALQLDNGLKQAALEQRDLQQRLWAVGVTAGALLLTLVAVLLRRMRQSNAQLRSSNEQLAVASERDPLTGLANRRHLLAAMERQAATGAGFEGSMLLIDIDHFKRINDLHGHASGDQVLVEVAQRLRTVLRATDLTVRWGGEEFLVVLPSAAPQEVEQMAQRLLGAIGGVRFHVAGGELAVTASIGFASFPLAPARRVVPWERAIDLVDTAMYLAKAHGRNRAYGVRALQDDESAVATAQPAQLESAWRDGRADLTHLPGPEALQA